MVIHTTLVTNFDFNLNIFFSKQKIQKVTGGLSRLASRSKVRKEDSVRVKSQVSSSEAEMLASIAGQTNLVRELVEMQARQHAMTQLCLEKYVLDEWNQAEAQLTRERAIWGPQLPSRYLVLYNFGLNSFHYDGVLFVIILF